VVNQGGGDDQPGQQGGDQQGQQGSQPGQQQGSQQQGNNSSGMVPADNPVQLFYAIRGLYKSGRISRDQVDKAFKQVLAASFGRVTSLLHRDEEYTAGRTDKRMSPTLQRNWDRVKGYLARLRDRGIKARDQVVDYLQRAFTSWMTPELAVEAYQQYAVFASMDRVADKAGVSCRFEHLTSSQRKRMGYGYVVGARVQYNPYTLASNIPGGLIQSSGGCRGQVGVIRSIDSELYNVEMPDGQSVSAFGGELSPIGNGEEITSGRGKHKDQVRELVVDFLKNIPTFTKVPDDPLKIWKEILEEDHVCYVYTETISNGKPYSVEFHVTPFEPFADIYVVRDFDNTPLEAGGFTINDFNNWSLSDVEHIEALFAKELARTGEDASFDKESSETGDYLRKKKYKSAPFLEYRSPSYMTAGFDRWFNAVGDCIASGRRLSLTDMAILSGVAARVVSAGGFRYSESHPHVDGALIEKAKFFADKSGRSYDETLESLTAWADHAGGGYDESDIRYVVDVLFGFSEDTPAGWNYKEAMASDRSSGGLYSGGNTSVGF
jgi:hypothetical protein